MRPPEPPLGDDALTLRPWAECDLAALERLWSAPEVQRWTLQPVPFDAAEARAYLRRSDDGWRTGTVARFAIVELSGEEPVGAVSLRSYHYGIAEIAYALIPAAWGRGLATRAVCLVSRWAFRELGVDRIELLTHPENEASQRVAQRAGYTREGVLRSAREQRGRRFDCVCWSLLPTDPAFG